MAGHSPTSVQTYTIDDAAGVVANVCVVMGAADGGCKKPAGANAAGFLGVTQEDQSTQNKNVPVAKSGTVRIKYGGNITRGDRVKIGGTTGSVVTCEALIVAAPGTASVQEVVGIAEVSGVSGDLGLMTIRPYTVNIAAS